MASKGRGRADARIRKLDERFDLFVESVRDLSALVLVAFLLLHGVAAAQEST